MIQILYFFLCLAAGNTAAFAFSDSSLTALEQKIVEQEKSTQGLKPGNEARIDFFQGAQKTKISFLYLHGFSASPKESSPLVEDLAKEWKANAYFPRFQGHGIKGAEGLRGVKLADWENQAQDALEIATQLGEQVVVVSMSTGSSLAIPVLLENSSAVAAHIMLSPNFRLADRNSQLLLLPFAEWIARIFIGEYRQWKAQSPDQEYFWTTRYPSTVLVEVVEAAAKAKGSKLAELKMPTLLAYHPADSVVDVPSILSAFEKIGAEKKLLLALPEAEGNHNISGNFLSPLGTKLLFDKINRFLELIMGPKRSPNASKFPREIYTAPVFRL